ncbi:MAG: hypothetical protein A3E78_11950 [Alphaproteobacteria bacterium RIFCSPHIGHO2_12_FULL_63_12]|nr:MAG: hypothetical protein A3E78_11950 [Alphaproteobacteria bacterium RIFCSPHIGHO2_12_FULL_63_12]
MGFCSCHGGGQGVGEEMDRAAQDGFGGGEIVAREIAQEGHGGPLAGEACEEDMHLGNQPTDETGAFIDEGAVGDIIFRGRRALRHGGSIHPAAGVLRKFARLFYTALILLEVGWGNLLRKGAALPCPTLLLGKSYTISRPRKLPASGEGTGCAWGGVIDRRTMTCPLPTLGKGQVASA